MFWIQKDEHAEGLLVISSMLFQFSFHPSGVQFTVTNKGEQNQHDRICPFINISHANAPIVARLLTEKSNYYANVNYDGCDRRIKYAFVLLCVVTSC